MVGMGTMRKLSERYKLPARTAPEIVRAFRAMLTDLQVEREILFNDAKLSGEALVSAIVLDFLAKGDAEKRAIVERRVPDFETILRGERSSPLIPGPSDRAEVSGDRSAIEAVGTRRKGRKA